MTIDFDAIYKKMVDQIGRTNTRPIGPISELAFQRFALAAGDTSGRYFSDKQAKEEGFERVIAPPLFLSSVMGWDAGPEEASLRGDGLGADVTEALPLDGLRIMGAGQELEFFQPVTDGAQITEEVSVEDVHLKQGRSGTLLIYRLRRRYIDQKGDEILRCHENFIGR